VILLRVLEAVKIGCLTVDDVVGFIASADKPSVDPFFELLPVLCKAVLSSGIIDFFSVGCERTLGSMELTTLTFLSLDAPV